MCEIWNIFWINVWPFGRNSATSGRGNNGFKSSQGLSHSTPILESVPHNSSLQLPKRKDFLLQSSNIGLLSIDGEDKNYKINLHNIMRLVWILAVRVVSNISFKSKESLAQYNGFLCRCYIFSGGFTWDVDFFWLEKWTQLNVMGFSVWIYFRYCTA